MLGAFSSTTAVSDAAHRYGPVVSSDSSPRGSRAALLFRADSSDEEGCIQRRLPILQVRFSFLSSHLNLYALQLTSATALPALYWSPPRVNSGSRAIRAQISCQIWPRASRSPPWWSHSRLHMHTWLDFLRQPDSTRHSSPSPCMGFWARARTSTLVRTAQRFLVKVQLVSILLILDSLLPRFLDICRRLCTHLAPRQCLVECIVWRDFTFPIADRARCRRRAPCQCFHIAHISYRMYSLVGRVDWCRFRVASNTCGASSEFGVRIEMTIL